MWGHRFMMPQLSGKILQQFFLVLYHVVVLYIALCFTIYFNVTSFIIIFSEGPLFYQCLVLYLLVRGDWEQVVFLLQIDEKIRTRLQVKTTRCLNPSVIFFLCMKYSMLPSFRTGPVFVQKELCLIIFVGHLNLRQPKNCKSKRNISAINCWFCRAF